MTPNNIAALVNLTGFITGAALYAMLLAMILKAGSPGIAGVSAARRRLSGAERLLLVAALLGMVWNLGALVLYGARDWQVARPAGWFEATVFASLGFLPALVIHFVLHAGRWQRRRIVATLIIAAAYVLSAAAGVLQYEAALAGQEVPSGPALRSLTYGFSLITIAILLYAGRSSMWKRAILVVALAVFAVSALHLSRHTSGDYPWFVELTGHHASLLLVIAILYQEYRFALVDIFLKRAIGLVLLVGLAFGLYVLMLAPLFRIRDAAGYPDTRAVVVLLAVWTGTALLYSPLSRWVSWFVDTIVLHREDYQELRDELAVEAASSENIDEILDGVCLRLKRVLTAVDVGWVSSQAAEPAVGSEGGSEGAMIKPSELVRLAPQDFDGSPETAWTGRFVAQVRIPTHEEPAYSLLVGELSAGRQLLSDDILLLESVALMLARRFDALRVSHERWERTLREQEIRKLAAEAELKALRAQLNPHFLFNALTTISYLIQTSPDRAGETLLRLTGLLRAVLRAPTGELVTLGQELELIESYLAIEKARFEDRLRVSIDVPQDLRGRMIPPLVVQPLVENAIKHGIAPLRDGGEVVVSARLEESDSPLLRLSVRDSGAGVTDEGLRAGREHGVGVNNVENRLARYYGEAASITISSVVGEGTLAEIRLPVQAGTSGGPAGSGPVAPRSLEAAVL